jgi:hypothetical protein
MAAWLSSQAGAGEILLSDAAAASAGLAGEGAESRQVALKGIEGLVEVRMLGVGQTEGS